MAEIKKENGTTHERVGELLFATATGSDDQTKINNLITIQELIIHQEPTLLDNFLDEVMQFQHDRSADVRKAIVGFIEEACKVDNELLPKVMHNLQRLLSDTSVAVQKRVIQALTQLYKITLSWLARAHSINNLMETTWDRLCQMKSVIAKMLDHDNDGVRTIAVKFYEMIIISQSYPEPDSICKEKEFSLEEVPLNLKIAKPRKLEEEAKLMFEDLVKFHGSAHISSANLMACMSSFSHIAKSRPQFLEQIVIAMEKLHANLPPTLSKSQVNSVRKHLKLQLLGILKHPGSYVISDNIKTMLLDLGATQHEINKALPSPEDVAKHPRKRTLVESNGPISKKRKTEQEHGDDVSVQEKALALTEEFVLQHLSLKQAAELVILGLPNIGVTMPPHFSTVYSPITDPGSQNQIQRVARLISTQMTAAGIGPGTEKTGYIPKRDNQFEEDEEMDTSSSPRFRDFDDMDTKADVASIPVPPSRPRMRALTLAEITKPLSSSMNETLAKSALQRVLKSELTAMHAGVANTRQKIISYLATLFSEDFKDTVVDFIMTDARSRIDLALSWLYEEYSLKGFSILPSIVKEENSEEAHDSYSSVFCSLVDRLKKQSELKERDLLISRLYLESPSVPEEGVALLRSLCEDAATAGLGIQIVCQLVHRPTKQLIFLNVLLEMSSHEVESIRREALSFLSQLYDQGTLRRSIEEYALMYLNFLLLDDPPALLYAPEKGRTAPEDELQWSDELVKACLYLFVKILPYNEKLIHNLASVYAQANSEIKRKIHHKIEIETAIEGMGTESPEFLKLVETCPNKAETLLIKLMHILTDKYPPSAELVARVRNLYHNQVPDVRILIPVLNGLTKKEVLDVLPKLFQHKPETVKKALNCLWGIQNDSLGGYPGPITPTELLITLHNMDSSKCDIKNMMTAIKLCVVEKRVYTQEVLAVVFQQLMDQNPLPTLMMRTVLQSLNIHPKLSGFVMNMLQRLIVKQVWKQKKAWEGFRKCCENTKPQSFAVILQLPPKILQELLEKSPGIKDPLLAHVMDFTDSQRMHIPKLTMDVLNGIAPTEAETREPTEETEKEALSPEPVESSSANGNEPPAPGEF